MHASTTKEKQGKSICLRWMLFGIGRHQLTIQALAKTWWQEILQGGGRTRWARASVNVTSCRTRWKHVCICCLYLLHVCMSVFIAGRKVPSSIYVLTCLPAYQLNTFHQLVHLHNNIHSVNSACTYQYKNYLHLITEAAAFTWRRFQGKMAWFLTGLAVCVHKSDRIQWRYLVNPVTFVSDNLRGYFENDIDHIGVKLSVFLV